MNSTNGSDGTWIDASETDTSVALTDFVGNIYVREKNDPDNFTLVAESPDAPSFTAYANSGGSAGRLVGLPENVPVEVKHFADDVDPSSIPWTTITTNNEGQIYWGTWVGQTVQVRVKATGTTLTGYTAEQAVIPAP